MRKEFFDIYAERGINIDEKNGELFLRFEDVKLKVKIDNGWAAEINSVFEKGLGKFDFKKRSLLGKRTLESQLVRLDYSPYTRPVYQFDDALGNFVNIGSCSAAFCLAIIKYDDKAVETLKNRFRKRFKNRNAYNRDDEYVTIHSFEGMFIFPTTAIFTSSIDMKEEDLESVGKNKIKGCLFKLAYSEQEAWELRELFGQSSTKIIENVELIDMKIPSATYNDHLVSYYKVAASSAFSDQAFLSYYHVLEYYFLRVSDEIIHTGLKSLINDISFTTSYDNVNKIMSIIKKNDNSSDELEMLKAVIKKYVQEDDLIEYVKLMEKLAGRNVYTNTKQTIFGENICIDIRLGHVIGTTAKVLKHIRNALVHSSDKYNRDECFLPFSDSISIVVLYNPIIKFLAQKVIFANAS